MYKLNKHSRYAIHNCIIILLLSIPTIFSFNIYYEMYKGTFPVYDTNFIARGKITEKNFTPDGLYFSVTNDKDETTTTTVTPELYATYKRGDYVELSKNKVTPKSALIILFVSVFGIVACIFVGYLLMKFLELYMKWLKGDEE